MENRRDIRHIESGLRIIRETAEHYKDKSGYWFTMEISSDCELRITEMQMLVKTSERTISIKKWKNLSDQEIVSRLKQKELELPKAI